MTTPTITAAYEDLASVIRWINERSKELNISGTQRELIAAACFDTVLEHQAAVGLLVQGQLYGSMHALLRAIAESFIRGTWFERCATDDEVVRFQRDEIDKGPRTLAREIEGSFGNATDTLSRMVAQQWGSLCSFAHTGFKQVSRRYTSALLKPNYPEFEVFLALRFAGSIGLLAAGELARLSKNEPLAAAILERISQFADDRSKIWIIYLRSQGIAPFAHKTAGGVEGVA